MVGDLLLMFLSMESPVQSVRCVLKAASQGGQTPTLLFTTNCVSRASSSSYCTSASSCQVQVRNYLFRIRIQMCSKS